MTDHYDPTLAELHAATAGLLHARPEVAAEALGLIRQAWRSGYLVGCAATARCGLPTTARPIGPTPAATLTLTIDSTPAIVELVTADGEIPTRLFEGVTASGIAVQCFVSRISVKSPDDVAAFARELLACTPPRSCAFDARVVL